MINPIRASIPVMSSLSVTGRARVHDHTLNTHTPTSTPNVARAPQGDVEFIPARFSDAYIQSPTWQTGLPNSVKAFLSTAQMDGNQRLGRYVDVRA